jgi:hypothetical protein
MAAPAVVVGAAGAGVVVGSFGSVVVGSVVVGSVVVGSVVTTSVVVVVFSPRIPPTRMMPVSTSSMLEPAPTVVSVEDDSPESLMTIAQMPIRMAMITTGMSTCTHTGNAR